MSNDYSTPNSADSGAPEAPTPEMPEWVKGNLPAPEDSLTLRESAASEPTDVPESIVAEQTPEPVVVEKKPARKKRKEKPGEATPVEMTQPEATPEPEPAPVVVAQALPGELSLEALVESLLFVADGPVPVSQIAEALEVTPRQIEATLNALIENYAVNKRGLSLQRSREKVQLTSAPAAGPQVERFLGLAASQPLTRASLEALAIIAYQQPITRPQIDQLRGVNSDSVLKNLLGKGLIEESGRTEGPGRPVLYVTTPEFLQYFGLATLAELPSLNLEQLTALAKATPPEEAAASETVAQATEFLKG